VSLDYRIYWNSGTGGPVDIVTPLTTTSSLSYLTAALTYPNDYTFLVRTYDNVTGYEDNNSDALVRLVLDASGIDVTSLPAPPTNLSASPIIAGGIRVEWSYLPVVGYTLPTSFSVWCQVGALSYALTPTTATYDPGRIAFSVDIPSLTDGSTYTIGVRATNATGTETNTTTTTAIADATGPLPVASLTGVSTY
jgi:hypothetical protein